MQGAFIATCLLGSWVFWRRRRIDPMLLGFVGCLFYFAPRCPAGSTSGRTSSSTALPSHPRLMAR